MYELDSLPLGEGARRVRSQQVLERPENQRQRRSEFVGDVREECGLCSIDLGERFGPLALLLVRTGVGERSANLAGHEFEKCAVLIVKWPLRVETDDEPRRVPFQP